jgi:hypothetical protein
MQPDTLSMLVVALARALSLLKGTFATQAQIAQLLNILGWEMPPGVDDLGLQDLDLDGFIKALSAIVRSTPEEQRDEIVMAGRFADLLLAIQQLVAEVVRVADTLPTKLATAGDYVEKTRIDKLLPTRLLDYLIIQYVARQSPTLYGFLVFFGIFRQEKLPAEASIYQTEHIRMSVEYARISKMFSDPQTLFVEVYQWGKSDFDAFALLVNIGRVLQSLGVQGRMRSLPRQVEEQLLGRQLAASETGPTPQLLISLKKGLGWNPIDVGLALYPLRPTSVGGDDGGLGIFPFARGSAELTLELTPVLTLEIESTVDIQGGVALFLRPGQPVVVKSDLLDGGGESLASGRIRLQLCRAAQEGSVQLVAIRSGSRVEAQEIYLAGGAEASTSGASAGFVELGAVGGRIILTLSEGDGFLARVFPTEGIQINLDLLIGWSSARGLYLLASGGLKVTIPIHKDLLGILRIDTLYLSLGADAGGTIRAMAAATANLKLGPFLASVERVGLRALITFPESGGNLGPANFTLAFKPPDGAGMSINASAITGGGYLLFDQEKEQYAGILYLAIKDKIAITAIGLLTTRLPDGRKGFSLLLIITAEFPPIQLGYGFVLLGVGGLIGVNRTMLLDVLRAGIKNKTLDSILFPKNPIANAPKIISDLQAIFPPAEGHFVFGPMAKIAWGGAYPILTIELGILIELGLEAGLPASVRLALLGKVTLALPRREKPEDKVIVYLNLEIMGLVDFDKSDASVDATLFDSRIAEFPITGDMAMRLNWGAGSTFVMAAGGFHPRFQPPPNFPALDRLAISIAKGDNPRLRLESYMAITANTVQFGARLDVYVAYAGFTGAAVLAFDALVEFPFHVIVDMEGGVVVKWKGNSILTATLFLALSGPGPWCAVGQATFHFLGFKRQLPINLTSGEATPLEPLPPSQPFVQLQNQFKDTQNWSAQLPAAEHMNVTLRQAAVAEGILVHPLGSLTVRQSTVLLDVAISRFANTTPDTSGPFVVEKVAFGNGAAVAEQTSAEVRDNFAPAQFFQMSDEEKLGSPAFQPLPAGRTRIGTIQIKCSEKPISRGLGYDTVVIDALEAKASRSSKGDKENIFVYSVPQEVLLTTAMLGAAGQSLLRSTGSATYVGPTDRRVKLKNPEYVVVSDEDMSYDKNTDSQPSEVEARQHLRQKGARGYQVVGSHEVT